MPLGIPAAFCLLLEYNNKRASEYDIQMFELYEERLKVAGFGNYSGGKTLASSDCQRPALGKITQNFLEEFNAVLNSAEDRDEATQIFYDYNEQLVLAGYSNHYHTDYFATMVQMPTDVFAGLVSNASNHIAAYSESRRPVQDAKALAKQQASMIRVGFLAAANLLSELEMGHASEDDLRLLGRYEALLKRKFGCYPKPVRTRPARYHGWPPPTLGLITSNFLQYLAEEVASIPDIETKSRRLDEFDERLRLSGYGDHYDATKIMALRREFENDLRIAAGVAPLEEPQPSHSKKMQDEAPSTSAGFIGRGTAVSSAVEATTSGGCNDESRTVKPVEFTASINIVPIEAEASSDTVCDEVSSQELVEAIDSTVVEADINDIHDETTRREANDGICNMSGIDASKVTDANTSEVGEDFVSEKLTPYNIVTLDISSQLIRPRIRIGSEEDAKDPRITYEVVPEETQSEQIYRQISEERQATNKVASLVADKESSEVTNEHALKMTVESTSFVRNNEAHVVISKEATEVTGEDASDLTVDYEGDSSDDDASVVTIKDASEVTDVGILEETNIYPDESHDAEKVNKCTLQQGTSGESIPRNVKEGGSNLTNGETSKVAENRTSQLTDDSSTRKPEKLKPALPPVHSRGQRRRQRDPRVTYALKHSVPVEERFKVVARRRLPAPVDWFTTDLAPPPEYKNPYLGLYSDLPLVIKAFAFSERLNEIDAQIENAASHMIVLLQKQYDGVVAAFEKYLSDVRAERDKEPKRRGRQPPNQEKWRRPIIIWLVLKRNRYPPRFRYSPLDFSCPLTIRASTIAERMKWIDTRLANGNASQALGLIEEFVAVVRSIYGNLYGPISGEAPPDDTPRPLPPDLDELRIQKNRALKDYKNWPSSENKQLLNRLTTAFKRRIAIYRESEESARREESTRD